MIAQIEGKISHAGNGFIIVNAGGVGYKVNLTKEELEDVAKTNRKEISLWTHLSVREDAMDLYGFAERDSLNFFELMISVSGIGPKSALAILNIASVKTLQSAIASGDPEHFTKTTGIGTKKAEKIILELRDKLHVPAGEISAQKDEADVIEALKALGYSEREARDSLKKIAKGKLSAEQKIKQALKNLSR